MEILYYIIIYLISTFFSYSRFTTKLYQYFQENKGKHVPLGNVTLPIGLTADKLRKKKKRRKFFVVMFTCMNSFFTVF